MARAASIVLATVAALVSAGLASSTASAATATACSKPASPGTRELTVVSGGKPRALLLHVPKGYDGRSPIPLVFDLHGTFDNREGQLATSRSEAAGDRHGYAIAAPNGGVPTMTGFNGQGYLWNSPGKLQFSQPRPADAPDEVLFVSDAIDAIGRAICLDYRRVYSMGYSNGGRISSWFACTLASRLAAIAPVAGVRAGYAPATGDRSNVDPKTCLPSRPISVLAFHGTSDPIAPYGAGGAQDYQGYSVPVAVKRWADLDGCSTSATKQVSPMVVLTSYGACRGSTDVGLYTVNGGGHTWPGTSRVAPFGVTTQEIDATELAFKFFAVHSLPALPAMRLSASTARLTTGRRTRVTFTATWRRGGDEVDIPTAAHERTVPLAGVAVKLLGRGGHTGADGRVTLNIRPRGTGPRRAVASKAGYAAASYRFVANLPLP